MIDYTILDLEPVLKAYEEQSVVPALVGDVSGNGHQVFVFGVPAFLPYSQETEATVEEGREIDVCVIKILPESNNVIVSAKVAYEQKALEDAQTLNVGDVVRVRVTSIADYGVFVTTEAGVDGLILLKNLSYKRIKSADEVVSVGDVINAEVINVSKKGKKTIIEFSHKNTLPDPWDNTTIEEGQIVEGIIVNISSFGLFVEVGSIIGLIHQSEITWARQSPKPQDYFSPGDKVKAKVISINKEEKKLALSIRCMEENPWDRLNLNKGDIIESKIQAKTEFGLFLEVSDGIQGVLHKNDLAWTSKEQAELFESLQIGATLNVAVKSIDEKKRRISLSRKKLCPHPYDVFLKEHPTGSVIEGIVVDNSSVGEMKVDLPINTFTIQFSSEDRNRWEELVKQYPVGAYLPLEVKAYSYETHSLLFRPVISTDESA